MLYNPRLPKGVHAEKIDVVDVCPTITQVKLLGPYFDNARWYDGCSLAKSILKESIFRYIL